jgi:hypothetical protein
MIRHLTTANTEMLQTLRAFEALLLGATPPNRRALAAVRLRLSRLGNAHLKLAMTQIYPVLDRGSDMQRAACREFKALMLDLHAQLGKHIGRWHNDEAIADWEGYRLAVRPMLIGVRQRIAFENRVIAPLIAREPVTLRIV